MAGIGFQLRKVIGRGGIGQTVGALVSGVFVVAGPWLLSIVSMILLQGAFSRFAVAQVEIFQGFVVYCYAFSLSLFAGVHHHFTRLTADLVWEDRHGEAAAWMLRFVLLVLAASLALAGPAAAFMPLEVAERPDLFRWGLVLLYAAINVLWIVMLFISLLKRYTVILVVFGGGMALSVAAAILLARRIGVSGALLGYAAGILCIDIVFIVIACVRFPPRRPAQGWRPAGDYVVKYWALILSGFFFYSGQWLDKFYFWLVRGVGIPGTVLRIYPGYDYAVYIAGLSVIPGLVYFIVITETQLYTDLKHFLFSLNNSSWSKIQGAKRRMIVNVRQELRDQSLFQLSCSFGLAFVAGRLGIPDLAGPEMWFALTAAFFQFTLLTLLVYLYYFELYGKALLAAGLYFAGNGVLGALLYTLFPALPAGLGHSLAAAAAVATAYLIIRRDIERLDRIVFLRNLGI